MSFKQMSKTVSVSAKCQITQIITQWVPGSWADNGKCPTPIQAETVSRHNEVMTPGGWQKDVVDWRHRTSECSSSSSTGEPCDEGSYAPLARVWTSLVPERRTNESRHAKATSDRDHHLTPQTNCL